MCWLGRVKEAQHNIYICDKRNQLITSRFDGVIFHSFKSLTIMDVYMNIIRIQMKPLCYIAHFQPNSTQLLSPFIDEKHSIREFEVSNSNTHQTATHIHANII